MHRLTPALAPRLRPLSRSAVRAILIASASLWMPIGPAAARAASPVQDEPVEAAPNEAEPTADDEHAAEGEHADEAAHDAQAAEEDQLLALKPDLAIFTLIVFLILLAVLWRFAWGPLSKALEDREKRLNSAFEEAEKARSEAAALLEQHRKQLAEMNEQARQIMEKAQKDAQAAYEERVKQAAAEADARLERATREIQTAKEGALAEIHSQTADLAVTVAARVLETEMTDDDHRRLVEAATRSLQATGNGQGGAV